MLPAQTSQKRLTVRRSAWMRGLAQDADEAAEIQSPSLTSFKQLASAPMKNGFPLTEAPTEWRRREAEAAYSILRRRH